MDARVLDELASKVSAIITPADNAYDDARKVWNAMIDKRPAAIVKASSVADVVAAVNIARDAGALLAVRCGAHSGPGFSTCDGGIVLDLSPMNSVRVDPKQRTAVVAGGALLGDLDRASQEHHLATTVGVVSHTGVGGLTLGGGMGRLQRKYGLTIDNLLACDVVTAAGDIVRASADENPELFWGLRGAGHNFGVVTSFEFQLHPVGPNVLAGLAVYPIEQAVDAAGHYRDWAGLLDDDVISGLQFTTIPESMPFTPEIYGMKALIVISMHVDGNTSPDVLAPITSFGTPAHQMIVPLPYLMLQSMADDAFGWGQRGYVKGGLLPDLTDSAVKVAVEAIQSAPGPHADVAFLQFGGAIARVPEDATAFSGRGAGFVGNVETMWSDPADDNAHMSWTKDSFGALTPYMEAANYVNLVEEPDADLHGVYGNAKYDRLVALKRHWDPGNLFRLNQNIAP